MANKLGQLKRLLRTTAFRAALLYACVFSLLSALGLSFIYWSSAAYIDEQIDTRLQLESEVLINLYQRQSMPALLESIRRRTQIDQQLIYFYALWGPDSQALAGRLSAWPNMLNTQQTYTTLRLGDVVQVQNSRRANDLIRVLVTELPGNYRLLVGRDLHEEQALLAYTLNITLAVIALIFLFAVAGSFMFGQAALRRIDAVSRTASEIMAGDLSQRIRLSGRDNEFDELGRKLNEMLERIEQLMAGMRQVTDNVAHDLRKPLNRMRNRLEVTLLEARNEEEYHAVLEQSITDADELLKTFNALLSIAQAEAGVKRNDWAKVDLAVLIEDLADLYGAVAEDQGRQFDWQVELGLSLFGNRQLLAQAIGNLLDNAVKYTPEGGKIALYAGHEQGKIVIRVTDTGSGIAASDRERVLQRFVRLDSARSHPGNGLGLSLVKAVAKLHRASLELGDNQPGLSVTLIF